MKNLKSIGLIIFGTVILVLFIFTTCSKKLTRDDLLAQELEEKIKAQPDDLETVKKLMDLYFFKIENYDRVIELFELNTEAFEKDIDALVHYGAALSAKAGESKEVEEQVMWVRKGMLQLDTLVEDYPDNPLVYIWRAVTYSNFPKLLDARSIVEDDVNYCFDKIEKGEWSFSQGELGFVYTAILNVGVIYDDTEFLKTGYEKLQKDITDKESSIYKSFEEALK